MIASTPYALGSGRSPSTYPLRPVLASRSRVASVSTKACSGSTSMRDGRCARARVCVQALQRARERLGPQCGVGGPAVREVGLRGLREGGEKDATRDLGGVFSKVRWYARVDGAAGAAHLRLCGLGDATREPTTPNTLILPLSISIWTARFDPDSDFK